MQYKFLISPWENDFIDIVSKTQKELFISSPFVNVEGVKILCNSIREKSKIKISFITNFTTQNIVNNLTEPDAILKLHNNFTNVEVSSLGRLHAKVYLIDDTIGIITSANLTNGGLKSNFEYGVMIEDTNIISNIKEDMSKYFKLGNIIDKDLLESISEIKKEIDNDIKNKELKELLKKHTEKIDDELLKNRIKGNKTINAIFSDTILYLLNKKGPLSTEEMHPLIQNIHPDICDDSIDRVINGQHFGKKWKHLVRDA